MRVNEVILKKIDLRERVSLQTNHKALRLSHSALPPPKKLKQSTLQITTCVPPQRYSACSNRTSLHQKKAQHGCKCEGEVQMVENNCAQQDKTYNNNYKRFPKRSFLRSCYVVQNSNIVIDIFSKKIELEERKNDFLARSLSLQLKKNYERLPTYYQTTTTQQKMQGTHEKNVERKSLKSGQRRRAESARDMIQVREPKLSRFTPWQVQILEYQEQIAQRL